MAAVLSNPLIRLEFKRRFRSGIAAWGIPILTLLPGAAVCIAYVAGTTDAVGRAVEAQMLGPQAGFDDVQLTGVTVNQVSSFGAPMLVALFVAAMFALMVLVPAVVGGSVSSERANQTLQPLQLTALSPTEIVLGKLVASVSYLILLLVCLAPVLVIPFMVGGVSLGVLLRSFAVLLLVTVELAAVALAVSSLLRKPVTSIVTSLLSTGALVFVPFIVMGLAFWGQAAQNRNVQFSDSAVRLIATVSPVALFSWVGDITEDGAEGITTGGIQLASLLCFGAITVLSLVIARNAVTAPVARDR